MATRFVFTPESAEFPSTDFPELAKQNRRPILKFDATTNETARWTTVVPVGWTPPITAVIQYICGVNTGDIDVDVSVEAITPNADTVILGSSTSFDTTNSSDNNTVPGTAGYLGSITVTLTNHDSSAVGDYIRFSLIRDAASDTAADTMNFLQMEIKDSA